MSQGVIKGSWGYMTLRGYLLTVDQHPNKFRDNSYSNKQDLMFLIYHVMSQNHLLKWSCGFMVGSFLCRVSTMSYLTALNIVVVDIKWFRFIT